jgi:MtN3 and saliva related transmembrane protein
VNLVNAVGLAATVAFLCELVPQPLRIIRTRSLAGLSVVGTGVYFVTEAAWVTFGLTTGLWAVLVTSVAATVLSGVQLVLVWPKREATDLWWMAIWGASLVLGIVFGVVGALLVLGVLVGLGPQAWAVWKAPVPHGVSALRWALSATSGSLWFTFGLLTGELPLVVSGLVGMGCGALALSRFAIGWVRLHAPAARPSAGFDSPRDPAH